MDPEQVTMYMELGSRVFSDLSGEDSGVAKALIKNRCLRAGYEKPRPRQTFTEEDKPSVLVSGKHYVCVMPLKGRAQAVLTVTCEGFTKKGNMRAVVTYGYSTGPYVKGKRIIVLKKDILCSAKGDWDA